MTVGEALEQLLLTRRRSSVVQEMEDGDVRRTLEWLLARGIALGYFDERELLLLLVQRFSFALVDLKLAREYQRAQSVTEAVLEARIKALICSVLDQEPSQHLVAGIARRTRTAAHQIGNIGMPRDSASVIRESLSPAGELRCEYCGYHFQESDIRPSLCDEVDFDPAWFAPMPQPKRLSDKWKPIQSLTKKGDLQSWTELEIEHRIPRAALGENAVENLAVSCKWCNRGKSRFQSFAEAVPSFLAVSLGKLSQDLAPEEVARCFYTVINRDRRCQECGADAGRVELTVVPADNSVGLRRVFGAQTICYQCK